jgi:hypothetical protein
MKTLDIYIIISLVLALVIPVAIAPIFIDQPTYNESPILSSWIMGNQNDNNATVCQYYNGYTWCSIFGVDDCINTTDAINHYAAIGVNDVPTVAYLYGNNPNAAKSTINGNDNVILPSDSELAIHFPHDWNTELNVNYDQSSNLAKQSENFKEQISIASKWSNNVISMTNPGDQATLNKLVALWEIAGIRIDGDASNINSTFIGSYFNNNYQPENPFDLMNIDRQINIDYDYNWSYLMNLVNYTKENNGVLTLYCHANTKIAIPGFVQYLNSTDQWKCNQGELASYIFGEKSLNLTGGNGKYEISKTNPTQYGYWNVPITICVNINKIPSNILVNGQSIINDKVNPDQLSTGYSIEGSKLYITEFWNQTTTLNVIT